MASIKKKTNCGRPLKKGNVKSNVPALNFVMPDMSELLKLVQGPGLANTSGDISASHSGRLMGFSVDRFGVSDMSIH